MTESNLDNPHVSLARGGDLQSAFSGITAVSANDIWAFGSFFAADGSEQQSTLVLHWNGASWKIVPSPNPVHSSFRADILFGGTVIPQGDLWLVGNEFGSTLALNATGQ